VSHENSNTPRFKHDCEDCKFVGRQGQADVYLHSTILSIEIVKVTLIKRHSSEGSDYTCREHFL